MAVKNKKNAKAVTEGTEALDSLKPDSTRNGGLPTDFDITRSQKLARIVAVCGGLQDDDLNGFLASLGQIGHEADQVPGDADANRASIAAKPSAAVHEELKQLFGEEAAPEFVTKVTTLFEAALEAKLVIKDAEYQEKLDAALEASYDEIVEQMTTKLDQYLDYLAEQWMEENKLTLESSIKLEAYENFIEGMKKVFTESYIDIPEDKLDVVGALTEEIEELKAQLNARTAEIVADKAKDEKIQKDTVVAEVATGLTELQGERLKTLSENIQFDTPENFKIKIEVLKKNLTEAAPKKTSTGIVVDEVVVTPEQLAEEGIVPETMHPDVKAIYEATSRVMKRQSA